MAENNENEEVMAEDARENENEEENAERDEKEKELEELRQKLSAMEDKYYRLAAEYDNYKKRTSREKDARYADAVIDAVAAILPVADNLERAARVEAASEDAKALLEGVLMVIKQMNDSLAKLGVEPIEALGKEFDPNFHNAAAHIEDDELGENIVAEEFMKGYIYKNERVVRHSMVKVAN